MNKALAFSSSALLFLLLANLFPFLAFRAQGREQVMNLLHSSFELATQGHPVLAALVAVFYTANPGAHAKHPALPADPFEAGALSTQRLPGLSLPFYPQALEHGRGLSYRCPGQPDKNRLYG